jgi:alkylation response protein AidB-like acyl-CoA dehydrogenase
LAGFSVRFRFTDEQRMLQESAERFLLEHSPPAVARAVAKAPAGLDLSLWQQVTSTLGWQAVVVPEEQDGLGLGVVELAVLLEQAGARLSPIPLHACALSALALRATPESPARDVLLQAIASGEIVSLAHTDARPHWDERGVDVRATQADANWRLNGSARFVSGGAAAAHLLVVARMDTAIGLFAVPADHAGVSIEHQVTLDQTRSMADVTFSDVTLGSDAALALDWRRGLGTTLDLARILMAAEQVGCAQRALDMTLEYVAERIQFGRTIASFQAVKHKAADMMLQVESARSLMLYAACTADAWLRDAVDDTSLQEAAAMVASSAGDAAFFVTGTGIQLHGGVGITEEYDIQLYFKRARALESYLGRPDESRETIAQLLLDEPALGGAPRAA